MAAGRRRHDWARTSLLAYLIAEPNRDREAHPMPYTPDYFNPYAEQPAPEPEAPVMTVNAAQLGRIIRTGKLPTVASYEQ